MKSYVFPAVVEQDGDAWRACVPGHEEKGMATWGRTRDEALRNLQEVVQMVVEDLLDTGDPIPPGVTILDQPAVAVNVG